MAASGLRVARKAAREDTRSTNLRLVLQLLFNGDALSRAELARVTELTPATISTLVGELEDIGLVAEVGPRRASSQIGKPPTLYELNPDAHSIVALDLSDPETLRAAVVDLAGNITTRLEGVNPQSTGTEVLERVKELAIRAVAAAPNPVLGIGIGTPGVVTPDGQVVEASNFDWHGVALRAELEAAAGVPVHVSNDANAAAIAEYTKGGHDCTNLAVIKIGSGVGAGFVLNGQSFRGEHAAAGEIGHLVVDPSGPRCRCGNHGCLETFASVPAIETAGRSSRSEAAERLGVAMAAIVAILDIDHILVAGPVDLLGDDFCQVAEVSLRARCLDAVAESVTVQFTSLGPDIVLLGAAGLVLNQELGVA